MGKIIIIGFISLTFMSCFNNNVKEKPSNLPCYAFFLGGADGGVWVDSNRIDNTKIEYLMYFENGDLWGSEVLSADTEEELKIKTRKIIGYNGEKLIFKND